MEVLIAEIAALIASGRERSLYDTLDSDQNLLHRISVVVQRETGNTGLLALNHSCCVYLLGLWCGSLSHLSPAKILEDVVEATEQERIPAEAIRALNELRRKNLGHDQTSHDSIMLALDCIEDHVNTLDSPCPESALTVLSSAYGAVFESSLSNERFLSWLGETALPALANGQSVSCEAIRLHTDQEAIHSWRRLLRVLWDGAS